MKDKDRLSFLKDRLIFRTKMFMEWVFVDERIIPNYKTFCENTKEIQDEIVKIKDADKKFKAREAKNENCKS